MKRMLFPLAAALAISSAAAIDAPDFAFPVTVIDSAKTVLETPSTSPLLRMQATMQIVNAEIEIDRNRAFTLPHFIDSVAAGINDPAVRGLLTLYQASLVSRIYMDDSYKYRKIDAPLYPFPDDMSLWSAKQFAVCVDSLVTEGLRLSASAGNTPLSDYSQIISVPAESAMWYPRLRDFTYSQAMNYYNAVDRHSQAEALSADIFRATSPGSPEWAVWAGKQPQDTILSCIRRYHDGDVGAYLLLRYASEIRNDDPNKSMIVRMMRDYVKRNSNSPFVGQVKTMINCVEKPTVTVSLDNTLRPGKPAMLHVEGRNVSSAGFLIRPYDDNLPQRYKSKNDFSLSRTFESDNDSCYVSDSLEVVLPAGTYMLYGLIDGKRISLPDIIFALPWRIETLQYGKYFSVAVVSSETGKPIQGISVLGYWKGEVIYKFGKTDSNGLVRYEIPEDIKSDDSTFYLGVEHDGVFYPISDEEYAFSDYYRRSTPTNVENSISFTFSRPLYRPGDNVEWALVAYRADLALNDTKCLPSRKLTVELRDANWKKVDSLSVVTDSHGRASGSFEIPTDRLAGRWSIYAYSDDEDNVYEDQASFLVSEFKAPVFRIDSLSASVVVDSVLIKGHAITYTGIPVEDAAVEISASSSKFFSYEFPGSSTSKRLSFTTKTLADGTFRYTVPKSQFDGSYYYDVSVLVTTSAAETASASTFLAVGKQYWLETTNLGSNINVDSLTCLPIYAMNVECRKVPLDVRWTLSRDKKEVRSGTCRLDTAGLPVDFSRLDAAAYSLSIVPVDTLLCDSASVRFSLYSVARNKVPESIKIIIPENFNKVDVDGKSASFMVGVPVDCYAYVYTTYFQEKPLIEPRRLKAGFNKITCTMPDGVDYLDVKVIAYHSYRFYHESTALVRPHNYQYTLSVETWRDNITPGNHEAWKLVFRKFDGTPVSGGLIATAYNRALDSFISQGASVPEQHFYWSNPPSWFTSFKWAPSSPYYESVAFKPTPYNDSFDGFILPQFNYDTYGLNHIGRFPMDGVYRIVMRAEHVGASARGGLVTYAMGVSAAAPVEEAAVEMDAAAPAVNDLSAPMAKSAGSTSGNDSSVPLRDGQTYQLLWKPDLSFAPDGSAVIEFDVPQYIGSLAFRAFAWTDSLNTASLSRYAVSSKSLMVQPNLPRFLREGDKASIASTVYNNSADSLSVVFSAEFFTPDSVFSSTEQHLVLAPHSSVVVNAPVTVPVAVTALGSRVKVVSESFSDGQQDIIPVLESGITVVDSHLFYLTDSNPDFSVNLPASPDRLTVLQYTANPVWDVVKSLPTLYYDKCRTSIGASRNIFGALVARGIGRSYPEVPRTLTRWHDNPADSALVSDLYKNGNIKLTGINNTPWARAAMRATERMQMFYTSFDKKEIDRAISAAVKVLRRLQDSDGGFRWASWSDSPSAWATMCILDNFGRLNRMGILDESLLGDMIDGALTFIDINYEGERFLSGFDLAYIHSMFPDRAPASVDAQQAIDNAVQTAIRDWRKYSTERKARTALMLHYLGNKAVAKQIIASIRQFEVKSPLAGISFPSVNYVDAYSTILTAFALIDPRTSELDAMKQWLVLHTQVADDLCTWNPTSLVYAILSTGTPWTSITAGDAVVNVNGHPLTIDKAEYATGTFSQVIPGGNGATSISVIRPQGDGVAYGSVTSVGTVTLDSVAAYSSGQISVDRRFLVADGDDWVVTDFFAPGQQVRVQLKLVVSRDLEYVTLTDNRPAALEPVTQMPSFLWAQGLGYYRVPSDTQTTFYISYLRAGTYMITYDATAAISGSFAAGPVTVQSQYAPEINARSSSFRITVN